MSQITTCSNDEAFLLTLIKSLDSPLNIQTLILVVFIDVTMLMPKLTNGLVKDVPSTNKAEKVFLLTMYVAFLKITTFFWIILIRHPPHTSLFLEIVTINLLCQGSGVEKNKYTQ